MTLTMNELVNVDFGWIKLGNASGYTAIRNDLEFSILAAGDLNGDGNDDLVLAARFGGNPDVGGENKVVILFYEPKTRNFAPNPSTQSQLEYSLYPRRASVSDFNGDGRMDLFIGDHGVDGRDIGYQNRLYLQTANGLTSVSLPGGMPVDYSHGLITADLTGDGLKDLLVVNQLLKVRSPGSTSRSYLVTFDGSSTAQQRWLEIDDPLELAFSSKAPYTGELTTAERETARQYLGGTTADFNRDGLPDLLLFRATSWQESMQLVLFESSGIGKFKKGQLLPSSSDYDRLLGDPGKLQLVTEAVPYDVDGDGSEEVIVARAYVETGGSKWTGLFMQALRRNPDGLWADVSNLVFPQNYPHRDANGRWPNTEITKIDLNGDGKLDLLLTSHAGDSIARESSASYWIFEDGQFRVWTPPGLKLGNDWGFMPTVVRLEGQTLVLGTGMRWSGELQGYLPAQDALNIRGWRVGKQVAGTDGSDRITSDAQLEELIDGGQGQDTVVLAGSSTQYTLGWNSGIWALRRAPAVQGSDSIINIELLEFADKTVIIESREHASFSDIPSTMYQFFILAFGAAPGVEYLQQCADAYRGGADVKRITNVFTTKTQFTDIYPTSLSNRELATKLVGNVVGTSATQAAKDEAINDITLAMNNGLGVGDMIFTVFSNLAAKTGDAKWGGTAQLFFNQIAVAKYYTEVMNQSTTDRATLASAIAMVQPDSNVSTEAAIVTLIGQGLLGG
jgi:hypothetical protein